MQSTTPNGPIPITKLRTNAWERVMRDAEHLLGRLWDAPSAPRLEHKDLIPEHAGVYLFLRDGVPIYVGQTRNLRQRLGSHCRPSSGHQSASLAFLIAREELKNAPLPKTRKEQVQHPAFKKRFTEAKAELANLDVRFTGCDSPEVRTVFEVYATEMFGTKPYNDFETH